MRLLGSTEQVVAKDKNDKNVPKLEIVDLILMYCNVANNSYQQGNKIFVEACLINNFGN